MRLTIAAAVVATLFATSVAVSGTVTLTNASSPSTTAATSKGAEWDVRIGACSAGSLTSPDFDMECIESLWGAAFAEGQLPEFNESMYQQAARFPPLSQACHDAGHRAGRKAFSAAGQAAEPLRAAASDRFACNNGFMHGVMDAMATSNPSEDIIREAYLVCEDLAGEPRTQCADGAGHAAWQITHDPLESMTLCQYFTEPNDLSTCTGGVIMQMYLQESDGSRPADYAWVTSRDDLSKVCAEVKAAKFPDTILRSCVRYAATAFSLVAREATAELVAQRTGQALVNQETSQVIMGNPGAPVPQWTLDDVTTLWKEALDMCAVFDDLEGTGNGGDPCRELTAQSVAWPARLPDVLEPLCRNFPEELVDRCLYSQVG